MIPIRFQRRALYASIVASSLMLSVNASAQNAGLEEIIVTALKRETTLQDTPIPVSVMTGDYLGQAGVTDLNDLQQIAPSLHMDISPFGPNINIRGVTTTDNTSKGDQGVGLTVDGITIGRPREMVVAFMDVERVEVLRGPQGTLYGKSTTGGVINVVSKRPDAGEFSGNASIELGSYNTQRMFGALNLPVTDNFAVRVAAQTNARDGYWQADAGNYSTTALPRNDEDNRSYRLSAKWDINDNHSLFLTTTDTMIRGVGGGGIPNAIFYSGGRSVVGVPDGIAPGLNEDFKNVTVEYKGVFGGVEVAYLGGERSYTADSFTAGTDWPEALGGPPFAASNGELAWNFGNYTGTGDTTSHEIRISNAEPGRLNWVVGYNDFEENLTESDHNWATLVSNPQRETAYNGFNAANATDHASSGVFGQVDFSLTDDLNLTAGIRRSEDSVNRVGELGFTRFAHENVSPGNCTFPAPCTFVPNDASQEASKTTWRLGFDYNLGDRGLIYGFAATGYKAGGFNDLDPATPDPFDSGAYEPEELIDYEFGYKGNITEDLVWNTTFFFYDYEKLQLSNVENIAGNTILFSTSVPAEVKGWENELTWTPTDEDRVLITFTSLDGEFSEYTDYPDYLEGTSFVNLAGQPINKVSDLTLSLDWSHDFHLASGARLTTRLYSRYDGGYPVNDYYSGDNYEVDSYTRTDANITYRSADDKYSIGAFVKNIENDLQIQDTPNSPDQTSRFDAVQVNDPLTYGVRVSFDF